MSVHVHDQLAYYRDLASDERRAVEAHLAQCGECRATLAAYQKQDADLASIADIRPHSASRLRPRILSPARRVFGYLGDALTVGGLAALAWMFALQVQIASQMASTDGGTPATAITERGITIPPTTIGPPSPWLPALPWIGAALLLVGLLFVLSRQSLWPTAAGAALSAILLVSFVPPLSGFPNPAGIYWRIVGGYSYDPNLPFRNSFLIADRPENQLKPYLDELIGEIGLTPLDPVQPFARYEILRVGLHPRKNRTALVTTRLIYADGSSRIYPVPMLGPTVDVGGFWLAGWRADGLQRLRSEHLDLPGQPFAADDSPIQVGPARRLDLNPAANRLDEVNPGHWLWSSVRLQHLVWAPDGRAFLAAMENAPGVRQLWIVPLDGSPPIPVGMPDDIREYGWSPDGQTIVYTRLDPGAGAVDPTRPYAISTAVFHGPRAALNTLATGLATDKLPGLTAGGAWFFSGGSVWLAPYDGSQARLLIPDLTAVSPSLAPHPAPDGSRLAFACGPALCLTDADGTIVNQIMNLSVADVTWAPDGSHLAVIDRDPNNLRPVQLAILTRDGEVVLTRDIAPGEATEPPQWTPDGNAVFVQTYPQDGRRIIALDIPSGQVLDLSQEHWDAYFALSPDGQALLLNNGRGDFWLADVVK